MKIDVIIRTHDTGNVHDDWRVRYCNLDKFVLIKGCFNSLIKSIKKVKGHKINLTVLDDHSSQELHDYFKSKKAEFNFEVINLEERGYQYSAHKQFMMCRDSDADYVYCLEDDYLHTPTAMQEMIDSIQIFQEKLNNPNVVLYPFDCPRQYNPPSNCFLAHGSNRHWRTGMYTTNVMFTIPQIYKDHWHLFEKLALNYDGDYISEEKQNKERIVEENTIHKIWGEGHAIRFNPVPSLALHMQFKDQEDPFIDWKEWWSKYVV